MTTDGDKATEEDFLRMVRGDHGHGLQGPWGRGWQSEGMGLGTGNGR